MKYLHYFNTVSNYNTKRVNDYLEPGTSYTVENDTVNGNEKGNNEPLTAIIISGGTITIRANGSYSVNLEYKINSGSGVSFNTSSYPTITVFAGDKVYFRGTNTTLCSGGDNYTFFYGTTTFDIRGNLYSLLDPTNFEKVSTLTTQYTFKKLFFNSNVVSASGLCMNAETLSSNCYDSMFYGCTRLDHAPCLPAVNLAEQCYFSMFKNCTSLEYPANLPAKTLASGCYDSMFYGSAIKFSPVLRASTLVSSCYNQMFYNCTDLCKIECHATNISAQNCTQNGVYNVAATGIFYRDEDMESGTTGVNGIPSGGTDKEAFSKMGNVPLTFEIESNGTIFGKITGSTATARTIEYNKNDAGGTSITATADGAEISVVTGDIVQFRGNNTQYGVSESNYNTFNGTTCDFKVYGNIMSLIDKTNFANIDTLSAGYTFDRMFYRCGTLTDATKLLLPCKTLTQYCYDAMFAYCTGITSTPKLPATTLAYSCYQSMFNSCSALVNAPKLPATTMYTYCYNQTFKNCTSLVTAPVLPALTLATQCYQMMFQGCTSLNYIKCLATNRNANNCTYKGVENVASSGTFVYNQATSGNTNVNGIPSGGTAIPE